MHLIDVLSYLVIPAAGLLVLIEYLASRSLPDRVFVRGDSLASLGCLLVNRLLSVLWFVVELFVFRFLYDLAPFQMSPSSWVPYVVAVVGVDFAYYGFHRAHHKVPALWAIHSVHHSSDEMNLTVGFRQPWIPFTFSPFYAPLALLGVPPVAILFGAFISMVHGFVLHTRFVHLPPWFERVFNTPGLHRVHHGTNAQYLDKNFGGIVSIWDHLFGTFEPEGEPVKYGMIPHANTYNPFRLNVQPWKSLLMRRNRDGDPGSTSIPVSVPLNG